MHYMLEQLTSQGNVMCCAGAKKVILLSDWKLDEENSQVS